MPLPPPLSTLSDEHAIAQAVSTRAHTLKRSVEIMWATSATSRGICVTAFAREHIQHGMVQEVKVWAKVEGETDIATAARKVASKLAAADPAARWPVVA